MGNAKIVYTMMAPIVMVVMQHIFAVTVGAENTREHM
jgi:hypothetical protein